MPNKSINVIFIGVLFVLLSDQLVSNESEHPQGYTDIVLFRENLIAVGSDGRIDAISKYGEIDSIVHSHTSKLNCAFANDDYVIVGGDHGIILYSEDGTRFDRAESGTDKNVYSIVSKSGMILAGSDKGVMLFSYDGKSWSDLRTGAKGNILSLSANRSFFIGITDAGEIIKSNDGFDWAVKDYNKEYDGYNPYSSFNRIAATENSLVIIGSHDDDSPSILYSSLGNVWAERVPFYYDDEEMMSFLTEKPNDITYDPVRDQFILACESGALFSLPTCRKCNEYAKISKDNLNALIYADDSLFIVGDEFSVFIQRF